jgi:type IV secretory pathway VirB10-like protein
MDWISDNFQIVILVLLALGSWFKSRLDAKNAEREETQQETETFDPEDYEWEQQPEPTTPPPLSRPDVPPPMPMAAFESAREAAATLKHQQDLAERLRQIRETKATTTGGASATRARVAASKSTAKLPLAAAPVSLRGRLGNKVELRRAVVLREILGPPVSQR